VEERLQKLLARAGIASRRSAERVMAEGRVSLNGETVTALGTKADLSRDDVRVDGVRIRPPGAPVYLLLNKPRGVVTTRRDPRGRATVMDLVPAVAGLFPVGRLDVNSEGLILLTNDGAFAQRVAHPRYELPRVYHAKVRGVPEAQTLARLVSGLRQAGETLSVDRARILRPGANAWVELTLHEGKNREVRRILEAVGHRVSKLRRVALGPLTDRGLAPGEFRHLTPGEVRRLTAPGRTATRPAPSPGRTAARPAGAPRARRPSAARPRRPRRPWGRTEAPARR
jgi:23S rRNA pseudouridine2605 synthase